MTYHARLAAVSNRPSNGVARAERTNERRWALRKSAINSGTIFSDGALGAIGCIVRDMSATGAKLELVPDRSSIVVTPAAVPGQFILFLEKDNIEVGCSVVWRSASGIGVRFISPMKLLPKRPGAAGLAKALKRR